MATRDEVYQAIIRADQAGDVESIKTLAAYLKTMPQSVQPPAPPQQGAFSSGIASYLPNLQETYGGVKTLLGVGAERVLGEGDISKGLIASGARSMQEANVAQAPLVTPERTSFTSALDKGAGSLLTEYLPYQVGAGATNLLESLAVMGAGSLLGSAAAPGVGTAAGAVAGVVSKELVKRGVKETAEEILKERGEEAAKEYVEQQTKMVAANLAAKAGATTALAGQAAFYGTGQTTSRAVEEAQKMGGSATDIELARVLPAAAVYTVAEFIGDKIGVGALKGAGSVSSGLALNVAKQILLTGTKEAPVEVIQQAAERYGAKLSLSDAQAIKEYIDSAAGAYAMSVTPGGIGGVRGYMQAKADAKAQAEANEPVFTPVVPESTAVAPAVPAEEQFLQQIEDITGVTRAAPPSAQESAETFDRLKIELQQRAIDADAERIAELNRRQGIAAPARPKGVIEERPSMATMAPELTSQEDLLAKQAEVDARRLAAGLATGESSLTPGVEPTAPVVEEPKAVPTIVDNRPLTERAAQNRLLVMSNMLANQGGDPASLTIAPHPTVPNKFVIQSLDVPVKFTKELPTTPSDKPVTPPIIDPVNAYVEVQRRTNTPAARRFVSDFDSGNVTREDVESAIAAERKAAEPPLAVLPEGEIVSAPTEKTKAEPTSFQLDLKQKVESNSPFAITRFGQDGKNVYYASPEETLEANQRTELALTQQEQQTADAIQARLDGSTTKEARTAAEAELQSALRKATSRALFDVKVNKFVPPLSPEGTVEEPPTVAPPVEAPPAKAEMTLQEFETRMPLVFDKPEVRSANVAGSFKQMTAALQLSSNPTIRRIGQLGAGIASKITLRKPGKIAGHPDAAGVYRYADDSIQMIPSHAGSEHTNAHETVHALISKAQRNPTDRQKPIAAEIVKLYEFVKKDLQRKGRADFYGLKNEREFTAEAMTNPQFQYELMQIPYAGKKSAWTKFTQLVADLLGIENTNALTEVINLVDRLASQKQPRKKLTDKGLVDLATEPSAKSLRSTLGLYSELENKIQAGSPKAPAASWKAYINGLKQKGVKPEEIEWSGVMDWLDLQKGTVTKEDLTNYLKQGGVQVEETVLGQVPTQNLKVVESSEGWNIVNQQGYIIDTYPPNDMGREDAERAANVRESKAFSNTKFGGYTLPGGENYREVLLTLPTKKPKAKTYSYEEAQNQITQFQNPIEVVDKNGKFVKNITSDWALNDNKAKIDSGEYTLREYVYPDEKSQYRTGHWDQPNILAHIRVNDRTDSDGKKVLFVEEIQSDWGQEGKKRGFAGKPTGKNAEYQRLLKQFENNTLPDSEYDRFYELQDELGGGLAAEQQGSIPAAPFVTKTEGWLNLALKRIMVMASEEGYDRVAFVNGEQSADRYDLSKQISKVSFEMLPADDKYGILTALDKDGRQVIYKSVEPSELPNYIGKDVAQRLLDAKPDSNYVRSVSGLDLKVGGEGMKTFYDTIVPTALKKLLPKVGGGQLKPVNITKNTEAGSQGEANWQATLEDGRSIVFGREENAQNWVNEQGGGTVKFVGKGQPQPGFDVTPEMQEKVATTGLPMFSKKGERTQQLQDFESTLRAQLKKFGLTDVGLKIEAGMNDAGSYAQQLIRIAADSAQPIRTLRHESIHALREMGFFTDAQWKSLSKMAKDKWIDQYLKQRNVDGKPLKSGEESRYDAYVREYKGDAEKITEEAVADAFADFDATKPPAGLVQAIFKRLQNLFQSLKTALTNVESPEQIFGKVEKGELKAGAREAATESKSLREKATDNFKKWFKNSKVKDDDGQPKVMYHATPEDFTEFKPGGKDETLSGPAIWLSPYADKQAAAHNIGRGKGEFREGTNVMPVYVRMERPLVIDDMTMLEWARSVYGNSEFPQLISKKAVADMKEDGYDGIQFDGEALGWGDRSGETIVFDANQIKSAIGNNGEYSLTDADIRKSLGGKKPSQPTAAERIRKAGQEAYQKRQPLDSGAFKGVPEDLINGLGKVFAPRNETILDRIEGMRDNFWQRVSQGVADQYRTIKEYSEDAYMKARMSKTIDGGLEGLMFHGHVFNDGGALNIRKNTKGLLEVMKPVGKELDRYLIWVALSRDSTMPAGKRSIADNLVARRGELIQGSINGQPRLEVYQKVQKEMNAINRSVLKVAVDAGLLNTTEGAIKDIRSSTKLTDQEKSDRIAELIANPIGYEKFINDLNYIPFYKVMEDGDTQNVSTASGLTSQYFSKALKGGEKPFGDLMENTLRNWSHILSASMKNQAASATLDAAVKHNAATPNLKDGLEMRDGKVYSTKSDEMVGDGSLRPEFTENEKGAVKVMMDGQPTYYKVTDPLLLDSIASIGYMGPQSKFLDVAQDFKNILQYGVTISPTFKVNNLIRDSVQAMGVSELRKNPVANVLQGISLADKNSETYVAGLAGGAIFNFGSAYEGDQSRLIKRLIQQGVERDSVLDTKQRIAKGLRYSWDKYNEWGNKSESANRLVLYKQLRDAGMSHLEASFKARDLMDFSMQGAWPAFRFLTQTIPFLNARVQGLYKLGRDGIIPTYRVLHNTLTGEEITGSDKQKAQSFTIVTSAVALASAVLYLAFKDDEDFNKRDEWDRDNFWWIKLPGMDSALRIPKPFEIGAIGTLVERTLEQIFDSGAEGKQFTDSLFRTLTNTFALNPIPQMIKPMLDLYANKDSFTGAPIESAGLERLSKQERKLDTTSPLAIAVGAATSILPDKAELSPVQVDYLIKGYFGWLGGTIASISTAAVAPFKEGEYPDIRWMDKVSLGLVKELPSPQSKYVTAFYESNKEISQAFADMRHYQQIGDSDKAMEIFKEKGNLIALSKMYENTSSQMAKMRTQIQIITNDPEMDGAAKADAIDRMKMMMGQLAQRTEEIRKSMKP